jgi:hypothetical protein
MFALPHTASGGATIPPENRPAITRVIIGFGHRADAANLADAAGMRNVGLRR